MAYTPTVYTNDASSPDLDATNLNKSEQGIKLAHDIAVPVDCSSRVAEYTGDGIPQIPDNAEGTTYKNIDGWTTGVDEWAAVGGYGSVSIVGGKLRNTSLYSGNESRIRKTVAHTAKQIVFIIESDSQISLVQYYNGTTFINIPFSNIGSKALCFAYITSANVDIVLKVVTSSSASYVDFETIYIGTGAYDTPALDRAGNGNSLTLNAVTPVNGKYGKEMSFNGSTSYAQASSPVIGTTGTVAVRFKRSAIGAFSYLLANLNTSGYKGVGLVFNTLNILRLVFGASASTQIIDLAPAIAETTNYHTLIFTFSSSAYYSLLDATEKTGSLTNPIDMSVTNLILGGKVTTPQFAGIISHFRYDSRIWTADEARAWSLNPISIDSRV